METKEKQFVKNIEMLMVPLAKSAFNVPTAGFGGAIFEILDIKDREIRRRNINRFIRETMKKIKELEIKIDYNKLEERMQTPEFFQVFYKILAKIQIETREKIRQAYSNFLTNLIKEDTKINFDKKLFYLEILDTMSEDCLKILNVFYNTYKHGEIKNTFSLDDLYHKLGCYEKRKRAKGDTMSLFVLSGIEDDGMIVALNVLKASYFEGLLSDLTSKKLIELKTEIKPIVHTSKEKTKIKELVNSIEVENEVQEEYRGTELGYDFYCFIIDYK